ncbi:MAG TPA: A/G-specific adenine glycosylase [Epulopiscium sp.]|nr:A/G-specific adenine glycosylase [Candidatus Epulonipiscium sp.]
MTEIIQQNLLEWYALNHRALPFRENNDPYRIWISEVMLQQTQVNTVIPYYNRFMEEFPTVFDLASASEDDVYKLWAGLGYYSRARNLLKCAKEIVEVYEGEFPADYKQALKLPGIGPYTAGAVLSIAYNLKYPAVDGNVMRVMSRIYNITDDIAMPKTKKFFEEKVQSILPADVRHFNQAIMELGALVCTPQNPKCNECPLQNQCQANQLSIQDQLPVKTKKPKNKSLYMGVAILNNHDKILFIKNEKGLLSGLWGLPIVEGGSQMEAKKNLLKEVEMEYKFKIRQSKKIGEVTHIFTHKTWKMMIYQMDVTLEKADFCREEESEYNKKSVLWLGKDEIKNYAISTAFQKVLDQLNI